MAKVSEFITGKTNKLEEKWFAIYDQAQYFRGVSDTGNHVVPDWFHHDKFEEAQKFLKNDIMG